MQLRVLLEQPGLEEGEAEAVNGRVLVKYVVGTSSRVRNFISVIGN